MGLIRKSLSLGTAGVVKGSSKKQRVAKATLREAQAQTRIAQGYPASELATNRLRLAETHVAVARKRLAQAEAKGNPEKILDAEEKLAERETKLLDLREKYGLV